MIAQISYKRLFRGAVPSRTSARIAALSSPLFLLATNTLFRKNQQRREREHKEKKYREG